MKVLEGKINTSSKFKDTSMKISQYNDKNYTNE